MALMMDSPAEVAECLRPNSFADLQALAVLSWGRGDGVYVATVL
jgi:hypothetical protein